MFVLLASVKKDNEFPRYIRIFRRALFLKYNHHVHNEALQNGVHKTFVFSEWHPRKHKSIRKR